MKRVSLFLGLTAAGISLSAAVPSIGPSGVGFSMQNGSKWAKITYTLTGAPAIVTMDIETNTLDNAAGEWVSIGGENVQTVSGSVNRVIRDLDEPLEIRWKAAADWPDRVVKTSRIRAKLTLWPTDAPPDWLVIGLESDDDVRFYASTNFIPYGIHNDHYRTVAMVMRKISAVNRPWLMGSPDDEPGRDAEREVMHWVTFSEDYYIGIYELTQAQIRNAGYASACAGYVGYDDSDICPADMLTMANTRGYDSYATSSRKWWPQSGHTNVPASSIIGKFRLKTGLEEIDLPTEAQWEYACRAGTMTPYNIDTNKFDLSEFCHYGSSASVACEEGGTGKKPNPVGKLMPNAWGLYDMHGNVRELCLDRLTLTNDYTATFQYDCQPGAYGTTLDPVGGELCTMILHENGTDWLNNQTIRRGGDFRMPGSEINSARSAARGYGTYNSATRTRGPTATQEVSYNGARLCLPARFE